MSSIVIDKSNYWNFSSNTNFIKTIEEIIINDDFVNICVNNIFSKLNPLNLKKIILNNKILSGKINLDKFVNLEYLEFGEKFDSEFEIDLRSNLNLRFIKILSWNYSHPLDLTNNIQLESLEFGDFGIFNHPLDLTKNVNLNSLKLPSCYNQDLYLMNCVLKKFVIDKNYKSLVQGEYKNLEEFIIIGIEKNVDEKKKLNKKRKLLPDQNNLNFYQGIQTNKEKFPNGINPLIYTKRLKNLQKLKEEGKLDKYLNELTLEEFEMLY